MEMPTSFTPRQLELLHRLAKEKNAARAGQTPDVELQHLEHVLDDAARNAKAAKRLSRAAALSA